MENLAIYTFKITEKSTRTGAPILDEQFPITVAAANRDQAHRRLMKFLNYFIETDSNNNPSVSLFTIAKNGTNHYAIYDQIQGRQVEVANLVLLSVVDATAAALNMGLATVTLNKE